VPGLGLDFQSPAPPKNKLKKKSPKKIISKVIMGI
jgi:hypothetical protein